MSPSILSYSAVFCFRSHMSSESEQAVVAYFHAVRSQRKQKPPTPAEERMIRTVYEIARLERAASLHDWERQWG